ncbi:PEP-CTERM sorting domain-containing protein [Halorhodospira halophila]|uniref:Uncharacterized protein n=1 Tax=Halorhodospira halophila (strain DSM 244 / SL1) TaxID=349124 RepID=A1WX86_HALHL|nr:PEP-CTERM sorting domain-containing protein [Halorhodospira halophila]ABM62298.1 hypothetical protein Hhal_1531 [Halorhodospira halophila SL1]MBK1729273.1 PEP-CTERM sorting domain-containing protein [Halorhodospira halophila]
MRTQPILSLATSSAVMLSVLATPAHATQFTIDPSEFDGFDGYEGGATAPLDSLSWELRTATQQFGPSENENWVPDRGSSFIDRGVGRIQDYNPFDTGEDVELGSIGARDMTLRWNNIKGRTGEALETQELLDEADNDLPVDEVGNGRSLIYDSGTIEFFFAGDDDQELRDLETPEPWHTGDDIWNQAGSGKKVLELKLTGGSALGGFELDDDGNLQGIEATQFDLDFEVTDALDGFWATADGRAFEELIGLQLITAFGEAGGATERSTVINEDAYSDNGVAVAEDSEVELYTHYAGGREGKMNFQVPEPSTLVLMGGSLVLIALATTGGLRRRRGESGTPASA